MKSSRTILFAIIFIGAAGFFLFAPKQPASQQNFNFYNLPILIAILIWVFWKVWGLLKHKKLNS